MANKRHRTFTTKKADTLEPISFDLEVQDSKGKVVSTDTFEAHPILPGAVILDFVTAAESDETAVAGRLLSFFDSALLEESKGRFNEVIRDPNKNVDLETISEIISYLIEEYSDRPTIASE